jgi:protein subunit release factor A
MAAYDHGGGCPCGLYKECDPGCREYKEKTDYKKIREDNYEKHSKSYERLHMSEIKEQLYKDTDVRVIDQRIGMGIGGLNTVIRLYHKPTGILIEMPRLNRSQYLDKVLAFEMLEYALSGVKE